MVLKLIIKVRNLCPRLYIAAAVAINTAARSVIGTTVAVYQLLSDLQSNLHKWIALGPEHEHPLRQIIHISMFYTLHCV